MVTLVDSVEVARNAEPMLKAIGRQGSEWVIREWPTGGVVIIDSDSEYPERRVFLPEQVYQKDASGNLVGIKPEYRCTLFENGTCISACRQPFESAGTA